MFVPKILKSLLSQIFLFYPRPMYSGKHVDTQFCSFLDLLAKPQNKAMLTGNGRITITSYGLFMKQYLEYPIKVYFMTGSMVVP